MKKKVLKRVLLVATLLILSMTLIACNFRGLKDAINNIVEDDITDNNISFEDNNFDSENSSSEAKYTIADLKKEFTKLNSKSEYSFKPFYNVEQTTEFTFHFNSVVDPVKAITVHTDSKCEESSTIFQLNDGYRVENGVDVVVKPKESVLGNEKGIWGYAPIYYLCVRYDLDSTTVKKLDNPIIIPFTIKNKISTPNAYANVTNDNIFTVKWLPVENAVSYNVYKSHAFLIVDKAKEFTREECAYAGESIKLVKKVDASTLEFVEDSSTNSTANLKENAYITADGYVTTQNMQHGYTYYITAVDSNGNESFFSRAISDYKYSNILPKKVARETLGIIDGKYYIDEFKETVGVLQCDGKTIVNYPINYYKLNANYSNDKCEYRYEVVGTKLTGTITYYNAEGNFPESIISTVKPNTGTLKDGQIESIPSVERATMNDSDYKNAKIDLATATTYPENAKIKLDPASILRRTDLEVARDIYGGIYPKSLDSIESYVQNDNPEYIAIKHPNGVIEVRKNDGKTQEKPGVSKPNVNEKPTESEKPDSNINNNNYVDEQKKSTEKQVKEADKQTITKTEYPVFADTAAQKYLALSLINQEEAISLKAFPQYQNLEEFIDDLWYVWYQNPYIMGFDISKTKISKDGLTINMSYNVSKETAKKYQKEIYNKSKEVVNEIIKPNMSDSEKAIAIYSYLEKNSKYNYDALEYAMSGRNDFYQKYPNCWNTYGILCEELGVCQSYAYAFNILAYECDLKSVMVTGTLTGGGHAWNAVNIDNIWYMLDVTNNSNCVGFPYWICNSSTEFILKNGFTLDAEFVDGTNISQFKKNDEEEDWYTLQGLMADTPEECADIWCKERMNNSKVYMKYTVTNQKEFAQRFVKQAIGNGISEDELLKLKFVSGMGITVIIKP